ncbi:hypothetical protein QVD17_15942 [Tagetes erecta]|uniref:Uncharacterized protein n=1 Tax=Tagetes erecta TaxID=13708 RepID=A0AAD8KQ34_TARER|nr:hypothetical protein QVD17_15942 [Tagetes erecta]
MHENQMGGLNIVRFCCLIVVNLCGCCLVVGVLGESLSLLRWHVSRLRFHVGLGRELQARWQRLHVKLHKVQQKSKLLKRNFRTLNTKSSQPLMNHLQKKARKSTSKPETKVVTGAYET